MSAITEPIRICCRKIWIFCSFAWPNDIAPDVTIAGLQHGLHVFCEKPPGRDMNDIARVAEIASAHADQKLKFGFNHRYHDSVREVPRIVRDGELGKVVNLKGVHENRS